MGWFEEWVTGPLEGIYSGVNSAINPFASNFGSWQDWFSDEADATKKTKPTAPLVVPQQQNSPFGYAGSSSGYMPAAPKIGSSGISGEYARVLETASNAARASINEQFSSSLAELARREAEGQKALGALPGNIQQQFAQGQTSLSDFAGDAAGVVDAAGPVALSEIGMTGNEGITPFSQGLEMIEQSRLADVPLLSMGHRQFIGGQRTAFEMARAGELGELARQQAEYAHQAALAEMAENAANARAEAQMQASLQGMAYQSQLDREAEAPQYTGPNQIGMGNVPDAQRQTLIQNLYPERFAEGQQIAEKNLAAEGGPVAALQAWVLQGNGPGAQHVRAEMASIILASMGIG